MIIIRPKKDLKERYEPAVEDRGTEWRFNSVLNFDTIISEIEADRFL
ncbi:MAG: hypothetical protein R3A12_11880 [Ignavibacteria bacterium]